MPDSIPAVGAEIQPPNSLGAFSQALGIKQQMQNLQTGQAKMQQAQQENQELQALHQYTANAMKDPAFRNQDGSLNVEKFQQGAEAVAPTYGQPYIGQATQNANEGIQNRKALLDLSNDQRKTIGGYLGSVAANPNATRSDLLNAIEQARGVSTDPAYQRSLDSLLLTAPNTHSLNPVQSSQVLRQFARNAAMATNSPNVAESGPAISVTQGPQGLQATQTNPQSPLGVGPQGKPIQQGIAPQIIQQPGTGGLFKVGPNTGVTPVGQPPQAQQPPQSQQGAQGTNWWQPAPGQEQWLKQNTEALVKRAQTGIAAANTAPQAIDALDRMRAIMDQGVWTGTAFSGFKDIKNLVASMGVDWQGAQNSSELVKNMARYEAARAAAVGDTDASRALVEAGSPNFKMDAKAVKAVVLQSLANERIIQSYGKLMESSSNPQVAMQKEQQFRSIPHLLQMFELGEMRNKAEVDDFMKRYDITPEELSKSHQTYMQLMGGQ